MSRDELKKLKEKQEKGNIKMVHKSIKKDGTTNVFWSQAFPFQSKKNRSISMSVASSHYIIYISISVSISGLEQKTYDDHQHIPKSMAKQ